MKRMPRLFAACCTAAVFFATAALAETRTVTLSVSGMT
jgi:hypothetical protein